MTEPATTRVLAIDLRSSRLGFAVFEVPIRLLDWGKRTLIADSCSAFITGLLRRYGISLVVVRGIKRGGRRDTPRVRKGLQAIRKVARRHSIRFVALGERSFRDFFRRYERSTKLEIAVLIAAVFPDLAWALPRPRKCYEPENRWMSAFEAMALAIAFLATTTDGESVQTLVAFAAGTLPPVSR